MDTEHATVLVSSSAEERLALHLMITRAEGVRQRLRALQGQRHGGDWLLQNLRNFARSYPPAILASLRAHASAGRATVFETPLYPAARRVNGAGGKEDSAASTIRGIGIFALDTGNWPLHVLEHELTEFLALDAANIPIEAVRRWCAWATTIDARLVEFSRLLNEGPKFFTRSNLSLLPYLVEEPKVQEQVTWKVLSKDVIDANGGKPRKPSAFKRFLKGLNS